MQCIRDICYGSPEQTEQLLDLYLPDSNTFSVLIYFHGGGLEGGDKLEIKDAASYLIERNIAVASINYRCYPFAVYPQFIQDAAAAVSWAYKNIHTYGKCRGFFVGGSSAGAYLSMMLCFDKQYLAPYRITPEMIDGYIHNAGQPTCHFNVLRERGIDSRRVIIDESAPLYHVGTAEVYSPMLFLVSDRDMENRYEQTELIISTLKHFGHTAPKIQLKVLHGAHCEHIQAIDENNESVFGKIIYEFISDFYNKATLLESLE